MSREHQNRHVRGNTNDILMEVRGAVVVKAGDMMFVADSTSDVGVSWTFDNRAWPFSYATSPTSATQRMITCHDGFLGVAMKSSKSGVTEKITIATQGVFRMDLYKRAGVTVGGLVVAVSPYIAVAASTGVSPQTVWQGTSASLSAPGSTSYLGYCSKTESGATTVDFEIRTIFNNLIP